MAAVRVWRTGPRKLAVLGPPMVLHCARRPHYARPDAHPDPDRLAQVQR
jgi:hypothetical protein